jgi:hypothetical protein
LTCCLFNSEQLLSKNWYECLPKIHRFALLLVSISRFHTGAFFEALVSNGFLVAQSSHLLVLTQTNCFDIPPNQERLAFETPFTNSKPSRLPKSIILRQLKHFISADHSQETVI